MNQVATDFHKVATSQMWDTTKQAILENNTITLQLSRVSQHGIQLLRENDQLKCNQDKLYKELEMLRNTRQAMAKHSKNNQKVCLPAQGFGTYWRASQGPCLRANTHLAGVYLAWGQLSKEPAVRGPALLVGALGCWPQLIFNVWLKAPIT